MATEEEIKKDIEDLELERQLAEFNKGIDEANLDLDGFEIPDINVKFVKKGNYANKEITTKIFSISKNNFSKEKLDLTVYIDEKFMTYTANKVDLNDLKMLFGEDLKKWIGKTIKIKFSDRKTLKLPDGVKEVVTSKISGV